MVAQKPARASADVDQLCIQVPTAGVLITVLVMFTAAVVADQHADEPLAGTWCWQSLRSAVPHLAK